MKIGVISKIAGNALFRLAAAFLIVSEGAFVGAGFAFAETPDQRYPMQYQQLPADLRGYVDKIHRSCKENDDSAQPADLMQGINVIDLDGNGSRDLMVDAERLCNSWIKGGNCSNRGCDLKIWKQIGDRSWRPIFDEHVSRKFISLNEKNRLSLMAVSIWAGSPHCEPSPGRNYTSGQSCDVLVRYRGPNWVWEKIR